MSLEELHLLRPWWLLSLLPLAWLLWRLTLARGADQAWRRVMDSRFLQRLMPEGAGRAAGWPLVLAGAGWLAGSVALAGPAWERLPQPAFREQSPLVLTLAMTPSMQAADLAPNRLARARFELRDMLAARDEGRTGLVIYADEPFTVAPLTDDPKVIDAQVPVLKPDLMPGRGDRPDRAIAQAADLLRQAGAPSGGIVLLTDSAGTVPETTEKAAAQARAAGYPVSVLAVLPDGTAVPPALAGLAAAGGGQVVRLTPDDRDIAHLMAPFAAHGPGHAQAEAVERQADAWADAGFWLILLPLALAPLAFRRGVIAMLPPAAVAAGLILAPPGPAQAGTDNAAATGDGPAWEATWADLWARPDQQGAAALAAGDAAAAADLFADPAWQAAALYRAGDFGRAATALAERQGADAAYNRGNALAQDGRIEAAIAAYDQALAEMPAHEDARFNRDLLQDLLDRQKQQQQQQQQEQQEQEQQQSAQEQSGQGQQEQQQSAQEQSGQGQQAQQQSAQEQSGQGQQEQQQSAQEQSGQGQQEQQQSAQDQSGQGQQDRQQSAQDRSGEDGQAGTELSAETEAAEGEALGDRIDKAMQALLEPGMEEPRSDDPQVRSDMPGRRTERDQAAEQWLARVRDDPGALLREKLRRKYMENRYGESRNVAR